MILIDNTKAFFKYMPTDIIDNFISDGGVYEWAGGFTEGHGFEPYVDKIEGSIDSANGLPLKLLDRYSFFFKSRYFIVTLSVPPIPVINPDFILYSPQKLVRDCIISSPFFLKISRMASSRESKERPKNGEAAPRITILADFEDPRSLAIPSASRAI